MVQISAPTGIPITHLACTPEPLLRQCCGTDWSCYSSPFPNTNDTYPVYSVISGRSNGSDVSFATGTNTMLFRNGTWSVLNDTVTVTDSGGSGDVNGIHYTLPWWIWTLIFGGITVLLMVLDRIISGRRDKRTKKQIFDEIFASGQESVVLVMNEDWYQKNLKRQVQVEVIYTLWEATNKANAQRGVDGNGNIEWGEVKAGRTDVQEIESNREGSNSPPRYKTDGDG